MLSSKSASAETILGVERRILEMVARGDLLAEILDSLCRFVEGEAAGVLASISLLDGDRLRHGAAPSLPKAYTDAINGAAIGPSAGSCGTAAYRGEPVIVEDIAQRPIVVGVSRPGFIAFSARLLVDAGLCRKAK